MNSEIEYAPRAIDEFTSSPGLWVEAPLSRSQIQYLNNNQLGHYRSDFIGYDDETKKRHLFRLWSLPGKCTLPVHRVSTKN